MRLLLIVFDFNTLIDKEVSQPRLMFTFSGGNNSYNVFSLFYGL